MRELMAALLNDVDYQHRLREDFRHRRIHPSIETLVWAHVIGKPTEKIAVSADVTMNQKLATERALLRQLDLSQLEALAAESQALMDKALAMAQGQSVKPAAAASYRTADDDNINEPEESQPPPAAAGASRWFNWDDGRPALYRR